MQVNSNLLSRFMNFKVVAVVMAMVLFLSYLAVSGTSTIVEVNGTQTRNAPFVSGGHTYVPLNEVAQKMGEKVAVSYSHKKVAIYRSNVKISVTGNQTVALLNEKAGVPLKTKKVNGKDVSANVKAIFKNSQVYVPVEFLSASNGMGYSVSVTKVSGKTVIKVTKDSTVVKVNENEAKNAPFVSGEQIYVSLNEVAQKMGEKVSASYSHKKVAIYRSNVKISVTGNQTVALLNEKVAVPLKTKKVNGKDAPANVKAIFKNSQVYVPVEFLSASNGMGYPVKVTKESGKTVVNVGKIETPVQPKPETTGKKYPDGWVAPVLKSSWSYNHNENMKVLEEELGFVKGGYIYGIKQQSMAIVVHRDVPEQYDVQLQYSLWRADDLEQGYRIPVVSKELFKFYFEKDADKVWDYFNRNDIPEKFIANGRTVKAKFSQADRSLYLVIGYPNKPF